MVADIELSKNALLECFKYVFTAKNTLNSISEHLVSNIFLGGMLPDFLS